MSEGYPLPAYAAHIWSDGHTIWLGLPPMQGHQKAHTVRFPADERGIRALLEILAERHRAPIGQLTIGRKSDPTQGQLDEMLKHMRQERAETAKAAKAEAEDLLEGLDL